MYYESLNPIKLFLCEKYYKIETYNPNVVVCCDLITFDVWKHFETSQDVDHERVKCYSQNSFTSSLSHILGLPDVKS